MNYPTPTGRILLLLLCIMQGKELVAISMVYNFRIAQITKRPILEGSGGRKRTHTLGALLFNQRQKNFTYDITQNFSGLLGSYTYGVHPYYIRCDTAVAHIHDERRNGYRFSETEMDDVLFTFGRGFTINKKNQCAVSGLFGIPTHSLLRLQHADVGYSQWGFGLQGDGAYSFTDKKAFLYGARYIYFVPRNAYDLFQRQYRFTAGNLADFLLGYKNNFNKKHGIECGYTLRLAFKGGVAPHVQEIVDQMSIVVNSVYAAYKYTFFIHTIPNRFIANIAYGVAHRPLLHDNTHILTVWGAWGFSF